MKLANIYALIDPNDDQIRYIGKTKKTLEKRLQQHIEKTRKKGTGKKSHKEAWIYSLLIQGKKPIIFLLDIVPHEDWPKWECWWEDMVKSLGYDLTNTIPCGEALNYLEEWEIKRKIKKELLILERGYYHSKETKELLSKRNKEREQNGFINPMKGKKYDDVLIAKYGYEDAMKKKEEINYKRKEKWNKKTKEEKQTINEKQQTTKRENGSIYILTEAGRKNISESSSKRLKGKEPWNKGKTGYKMSVSDEVTIKKLKASFEAKGCLQWGQIIKKEQLKVSIFVQNKITKEEFIIINVEYGKNSRGCPTTYCELSNGERLSRVLLAKQFYIKRNFEETAKKMIEKRHFKKEKSKD